MDRKQRIKFGFIGLAVCIFVGALSVEGRFEPGQVFATIGGILFFIGAYRAIFGGKPQNGDTVPGPRDAELIARLADIQTIVISIDDRLTRLENQSKETIQ